MSGTELPLLLLVFVGVGVVWILDRRYDRFGQINGALTGIGITLDGMRQHLSRREAAHGAC